jgi:hypothetical protein
MSEKLASLEQQVLSLGQALREIETSLGGEHLGPNYVIPHNRRPTEPPPDTAPAMRRVRKHKLYDDDEVEVFEDGFNCYWKATTGKDIYFQFNKDEQPYITPTYHAFKRNELIYELLQCRCKTAPWIVDLCAGSGADLVTMLVALGAGRIDFVESSTSEGANAFEHGLENLDNCVHAFDQLESRVDFGGKIYETGKTDIIEGTITAGRTLLVMCNVLTAEYFSRLPKGSHTNLVNVDPPFTLDGEYEATDREMVDWFVQNVLRPMEAHLITTDYFCVKSRTSPTVFKNLLSKTHPDVTFVAVEVCSPYRAHINEADLAEGRQTKGVFYWIFFATNSMRADYIRNDNLWQHLVVEQRTVVVNSKKYLPITFPSYQMSKVPGEVVGGVEGGDLVTVRRKIKRTRRGEERKRSTIYPYSFRLPLPH